MIVFLVLFFCAFAAFSLSTICGGGAGLFLMPALGFFLPGTHVPAALSIGTFSSSLSRIVAFYKSIRWDVVRWFVPAALPAVVLGAWLLRFINPLYLEMVILIFERGYASSSEKFSSTSFSKRQFTSNLDYKIRLCFPFAPTIE